MNDTVSGTLFIVAAPSGGGKTSLVKQVIHDLEHISVSVSHTTRQKRPSETDGIDYFFVEESQFMDMVARGDFLEHAQVFDHYYGTSVAQIKERLLAGIDIVLDIDWQGAQQIRHAFQDAVSIFIIPPSLAVLRQRLLDRKQDKVAVIERRMQQARDEMSHYPEFDYLIVNDHFEKAAMELQAIVMAHRLRISRQSQQQRKILSIMLSSQ